ncbi:Ubiquitin carboxyl-terminal hydrolase 7, partial [Mucuna pruriens]
MDCVSIRPMQINIFCKKTKAKQLFPGKNSLYNGLHFEGWESDDVLNCQVLRKKYPQFGHLHNGVFMQQDAEECWTQLLYTLSQSLRSPGSSENPDAVKTLFGIEFISRIHCQESNEESSETESVYSLKCHISQEVNHL